MVIGFDGSRAFVKDRTGTENYSYQLLNALAKVDLTNTYIVFIRKGVVLEKFPSNFYFVTINWARFWTQGGLALKTFQQDLDVLFVPAHTLPVIRKPGLKTVVTVHDLGSEYLPQYHQFKQRLYLGFMQKYQISSATKLIAVSKATKENLVKKIGVNPRKVEVIYEGFDQKLFKPLNPAKRSRQANNYFLFVGTVQPRKNLERIIKAFAKFVAARSVAKNHPKANIKLVIAGSKGWMSDEIYKLPKELGIEDRVKFLGYVPEGKLPALYSGAISLVFPSLFEGFGLPILEAQACGCPVITSNTSSMPEVAGKGAIYVDPYDIKAIAHAMIRVKGELIKDGLENVKRFSWEKCAIQTLKVLESI